MPIPKAAIERVRHAFERVGSRGRHRRGSRMQEPQAEHAELDDGLHVVVVGLVDAVGAEDRRVDVGVGLVEVDAERRRLLLDGLAVRARLGGARLADAEAERVVERWRRSSRVQLAERAFVSPTTGPTWRSIPG